jgi:hypothetical protein
MDDRIAMNSRPGLERSLAERNGQPRHRSRSASSLMQGIGRLMRASLWRNVKFHHFALRGHVSYATHP